jgi:hypothetical protein
MPKIGKKFFLYDEYAKATVQDVVSPDLLHKASVLKSSCFASSYIENLGKGKFKLRPLPVQAQFAPVRGIVTRDIDIDGHPDLILSGNSYAPDASIGRFDALQGLYLKGDGKGNFAPLSAMSSGLALHGDNRSLVELHTQHGKVLLIGASNSGKLEVYVQ